jgi:hypothetical protein
MTYDASDPEAIARAKREEEDVEKDLDFIVSQPRGRRFLYHLIFQTGHAFSQSYVPGSFDATAYNEGARSVGSVIQEQLRTHNPKALMQMLEENHFDG